MSEYFIRESQHPKRYLQQVIDGKATFAKSIDDVKLFPNIAFAEDVLETIGRKGFVLMRLRPSKKKEIINAMERKAIEEKNNRPKDTITYEIPKTAVSDELLIEEDIAKSSKNKTVSWERNIPADKDLNKFIKSSQKFLKDLNALTDNKETFNKELSKINLEIVDLQHYVEATNLNACEGFKIYKKLKDKLAIRRGLKDKITLIESLQVNRLDGSNIVAAISAAENLLNCDYHIRTDYGADLFSEKFDLED